MEIGTTAFRVVGVSKEQLFARLTTALSHHGHAVFKALNLDDPSDMPEERTFAVKIDSYVGADTVHSFQVTDDDGHLLGLNFNPTQEFIEFTVVTPAL